MSAEQDMLFQSLYYKNFGRLYSYAIVQLKDPSEAEEVVQDTFTTAWQDRKRFLSHPNPNAYLTTVLNFKIKERKRQRNRHLRFFISLDPSLLPEPAAPSNPYPMNVDSIVKTAHDHLTEEDWELLRLFAFHGFTHKEICKKLHINVPACQKRLTRIREKLSDFLPWN